MGATLQDECMNKVKIQLIPHDGGPCPVSGKFSALIKDSAGQYRFARNAESWNWSHIIAYSPIEIEE